MTPDDEAILRDEQEPDNQNLSQELANDEKILFDKRERDRLVPLQKVLKYIYKPSESKEGVNPIGSQ